MIDNKGGHGIVTTNGGDENLPSLLDMMTDTSKRTVMIQGFVSARKFGDKRILLLNGKALGAFSRWPSKKDFRANIGVGASFKKDKITASEMKLVEDIAPTLQKNGLYFVGIDVIGEKLTEVNVTSPAGISDIITLENKHLEIQVADFIESKT
jgi:glutathione synthase